MHYIWPLTSTKTWYMCSLDALVNMSVFCAELRLEFCGELLAVLSMAAWKQWDARLYLVRPRSFEVLEQSVLGDFNWRKCALLPFGLCAYCVHQSLLLRHVVLSCPYDNFIFCASFLFYVYMKTTSCFLGPFLPAACGGPESVSFLKMLWCSRVQNLVENCSCIWYSDYVIVRCHLLWGKSDQNLQGQVQQLTCCHDSASRSINHSGGYWARRNIKIPSAEDPTLLNVFSRFDPGVC